MGMNGKLIIPESVRAEAKRQAAEPPQFLLPEDRDEMLAEVGPEHQVEAEEHLNRLVDLGERALSDWRDQVLLRILTVTEFLMKSDETKGGSPQRQDQRNSKTEGYISTKQAADYLGLSSRGVRVAAENGRLPGHKNSASRSRGNRWLFKRAELDKHMAAQKQKTHREEVSIWQ